MSYRWSCCFRLGVLLLAVPIRVLFESYEGEYWMRITYLCHLPSSIFRICGFNASEPASQTSKADTILRVSFHLMTTRCVLLTKAGPRRHTRFLTSILNWTFSLI